MGYGLFYNPIEQLVLEQFSAEPPFGGSIFLSNTELQYRRSNFKRTELLLTRSGVITQTPQTPCFDPGGPKGCVDFPKFRPMLLFGEFQPHLQVSICRAIQPDDRAAVGQEHGASRSPT